MTNGVEVSLVLKSLLTRLIRFGVDTDAIWARFRVDC